uniref:Uncharacterized protein n=1 Tax=Anguilla anguilla TaxID=7936 RepID=A0A0E9V2V6_ANGAN
MHAAPYVGLHALKYHQYTNLNAHSGFRMSPRKIRI